MVIESAPPRSMAGVITFAADAPALEGVTILRLAPDRYLAVAARDADLPARLAHLLAGRAAVTDQSDQWETFILVGADAAERLARLIPIDLHPDHFRPGDVACTRAAHLDVRLWRVADETYEISVTRSHAADLAHVLSQANV